MAVIDLKNTTIYIKDGANHSIEVTLGTGNLTYDEKKARDYVLNRGLLDTVRNGDEAPIDVRLDATWEALTTPGGAGNPPSVEDAMKKRGPAASWTSTSADPCEPYCVDIEVINNPPCGAQGAEKVVLPDFRYESINHDLKAGTLSFTGKCNVTEALVTHGISTS